MEGCPGWRYVAEELAAAGITVHLAEPADTAAARGRKRHAKTDKTDSRHLRVTLADGRLPECWIPPSRILECRALLETYHDLRVQRTGWTQRIHAVLFHQGARQLGEQRLRTGEGMAALAEITATQLSPAGQLQVATALDMLTCLDGHLDELRHRLLAAARQLRGARELHARLYGVGPITALALTCWLGGAGRWAAQGVSEGAIQGAGQEGWGRVLERRADRQLGTERRGDPADQPGGQQGVPAQVEEAVLDPDPVQAQHLREHLAQRLLPRRRRSPAALRRRVLRRRRPPPHRDRVSDRTRQNGRLPPRPPPCALSSSPSPAAAPPVVPPPPCPPPGPSSTRPPAPAGDSLAVGGCVVRSTGVFGPVGRAGRTSAAGRSWTTVSISGLLHRREHREDGVRTDPGADHAARAAGRVE